MMIVLLLVSLPAQSPPSEAIKVWREGFVALQRLEYELEEVGRRCDLNAEGKWEPWLFSFIGVTDQDGERQLLIERTPRWDGRSRRNVVTKDGSFEVFEIRNEKYQLNRLKRPSGKEHHLFGYYHATIHWGATPYFFGVTDLATMAVHPAFQLVASSRDGREHRFVYELKEANPKFGGARGTRYEFDADPTKKWAATATRIITADGKLYAKQKRTYTPQGVNGWPAIDIVETSMFDDGAKMVGETKMTFKYLGASRRNESEYQPENYGLSPTLLQNIVDTAPKPEAPIERPWLRILWIVAALALLVVGVVLGRRPSGKTQAGVRGFTLLELFVVVAIVHLLAALLMPAVQAIRESARRIHCQSNLRQISMALHQYEGAWGALPMGRFANYDHRYTGGLPYPCGTQHGDKSIFVGLLPFIDQSQRYELINHAVAGISPENSTAWKHSVSLYTCPTDNAADYGLFPTLLPGVQYLYETGWPMGRTSYAANAGPLPWSAMPADFPDCRVPSAIDAQQLGVFVQGRSLKWRDLTDGMSRTVLLGEASFRAAQRWENRDPRAGESNWWPAGGFWFTLAHSMHPPNFGRWPSVAAVGRGGFRSEHPGGLNVVMADGSMLFVSESISSWPLQSNGTPAGTSLGTNNVWFDVPPPAVWQAMTTRNGGESRDQF